MCVWMCVDRDMYTKVHCLLYKPQRVQPVVDHVGLRQSLPHYIQIRLLQKQSWPFGV